MYFDIESTFPECDRERCPYFISEEELNGRMGDSCTRVWAETYDVNERVLSALAGEDNT